MADAPVTVVTFLFTDIEGSTRLIQSMGDDYAGLLEEHNEVLGQAITENGGRPFGSEGDAIFAAFDRPTDAITAALEIQRRCAAHEWPHGKQVRVRIGIHTGEVRRAAANFVGLAVHETARICSAGHGGQILVSEATLAVVGAPHDLAIARDLGPQHLKDLARSLNLFQLSLAGTQAEFPPLRGLTMRRSNMPLNLTTFVGRAQELQDVCAALALHRLVTVTGPGGIGKTRLAVEIAEKLDSPADGIWYADFAAVGDAEDVWRELSTAIGAQQESSRTAKDAVLGFLQERNVLLLLDNCERAGRVVAAVAETILRAAPGVRLIATSREPLGIPGELRWSLQPLAAQGPDDDAVKLLLDRVALAKPDFRATPEAIQDAIAIAQLVDGIPLALELAAGRVSSLPLSQIVRRLGKRLELLTSGNRSAAVRHQTLRGAIDWSYDLLTPEQRLVLNRASTFAGGFGLEAAEAVCGFGAVRADAVLDRLAELVDHSLLTVEESEEEPRYRMLDTIREYASGKLEEDGDADGSWERLRQFYVALAEQAELALEGFEQKRWMRRLVIELPNIRAAMSSAQERDDRETILRIAGALGFFWYSRGMNSEGTSWFDASLAAGLPSEQSLVPAYRKAQVRQNFSAYTDDPAARARMAADMDEAVAYYRESGDRRMLGRALEGLSVTLRSEDPARSNTAVMEAMNIAREVGDKWAMSWFTCDVAWHYLFDGDIEIARRLFDDGLKTTREIGDEFTRCLMLRNRGFVELSRGEFEQAREILHRAVTEATAADYPLAVVSAMTFLGAALLYLRELDAAAETLSNAIEMAKRLGHISQLSQATLWLGEVLLAQHRYRDAMGLFESLCSPSFQISQVDTRGGLVRAALRACDLAEARRRALEAVSIASDGRSKSATARAMAAQGRVALAEGRLPDLELLSKEALKLEALGLDRFELRRDQLTHLDFLAIAAWKRGEAQAAATLAASAESLRLALGAARHPLDEDDFRALVDEIRTGISASIFTDSWSAGSSMSHEAALSAAT